MGSGVGSTVGSGSGSVVGSGSGSTVGSGSGAAAYATGVVDACVGSSTPCAARVTIAYETPSAYAGTDTSTAKEPSAFIGAVAPTPGISPTVFVSSIHTV